MVTAVPVRRYVGVLWPVQNAVPSPRSPAPPQPEAPATQPPAGRPAPVPVATGS